MIERAVMLVCYGACACLVRRRCLLRTRAMAGVGACSSSRQQPSPLTIVHAEATGPPRRERRVRLFIKKHVVHVALGGAVVGAVAPPARPLRDFLRRPLLCVCLHPQTSRMGFLSAAVVPPHFFIWVEPPETNIICKFKLMQIRCKSKLKSPASTQPRQSADASQVSRRRLHSSFKHSWHLSTLSGVWTMPGGQEKMARLPFGCRRSSRVRPVDCGLFAPPRLATDKPSIVRLLR